MASVVRFYIMKTSYFPMLNHVLKTQYDIVAVLMGIFQLESSFRIDIISGASSHAGPSGKKVQKDILSKTGKQLNLGNPNESMVYRGLGIGQCMGWYLIKGTATCLEMHGSNKYAPLSNSLKLLVNYGENPRSSMQNTAAFPGGYGPSDTYGLRAAIVASMVVLEEKLRITKDSKKTIDEWVYSAVRSYLGTGVDAFGTNPTAYAANVRQYSARFQDGKGQTYMASYSGTSDNSGTATSSSAATKDTKELVHCPQA